MSGLSGKVAASQSAVAHDLVADSEPAQLADVTIRSQSAVAHDLVADWLLARRTQNHYWSQSAVAHDLVADPPFKVARK